MSNVVSLTNIVAFTRRPGSSSADERPVVVSITDRDGSTLFSCPFISLEEGAGTLMPSDPVEVAFVRAALQHALKQLAVPETDPEIGADYTPV